MKKMIIAAAAIAVSFGMSSPAFADDPWAGFWGGEQYNPTEGANYSWVSGGIAAGTQVASNGTDGFVDGDVEGGFYVLAETEFARNDTQAWVAGEIEEWSGIAVDDEGEGGSIEATIGGYSGAWEDGSSFRAVNHNEAYATTSGDAHVRLNTSGGAYADFWKGGYQSEISVGGPVPPFNN